jgi:hypothetical protein
MTVHGDFSPEARDRANRTVLEADVFADHAQAIVAALPDVPAGHVLVAVVDAYHNFEGTYHVGRSELVERVPQLEASGGWAMVFTPGSSMSDVRRRTDEMAALASKRVAVIDRIIARRAASN